MNGRNIRNTGKYPKSVKLRSIKPVRRICCECGGKILGYGYFFVLSLAPGQYLCATCERKRQAKTQKSGYRPTELPPETKETSAGPLYTPLNIEPWKPNAGIKDNALCWGEHPEGEFDPPYIYSEPNHLSDLELESPQCSE